MTAAVEFWWGADYTFAGFDVDALNLNSRRTFALRNRIYALFDAAL
jgi:hypothetical protein